MRRTKTTIASFMLGLLLPLAGQVSASPVVSAGPELKTAKPVLYAEDDPAAKKRTGGTAKGTNNKAPKGMKAKHLTGEATLKGKDSKNIDFDAADIGGERKTPMGTLINQNKADKNYDFVKIRLRWHPEMVQSASSLDTGNSSK